MLHVVRCGTPSHWRACCCAVQGRLVSHAVSGHCADGAGSGVQMRQRLPVRLTHIACKHEQRQACDDGVASRFKVQGAFGYETFCASLGMIGTLILTLGLPNEEAGVPNKEIL